MEVILSPFFPSLHPWNLAVEYRKVYLVRWRGKKKAARKKTQTKLAEKKHTHKKMGGETSRFVCHTAASTAPTLFCKNPPQDVSMFILSVIVFVSATLYWGFSPEHFGESNKKVFRGSMTSWRPKGTGAVAKAGARVAAAIPSVSYTWTELCFKFFGFLLGVGYGFLWTVDNYPAWLRIVVFGLWFLSIFTMYLFGRFYYVMGKNMVTWGLVMYVLSWLMNVATVILFSISLALNRRFFAGCVGAACEFEEIGWFGVGITGDTLIGVYAIGTLILFVSLWWYRGEAAKAAKAPTNGGKGY